MKNHAENVHQKLAPNPFLILLNKMKEINSKIRYFERELSKSLKKVNFVFSFKPSLFELTELSKTKGV